MQRPTLFVFVSLCLCLLDFTYGQSNTTAVAHSGEPPSGSESETTGSTFTHTSTSQSISPGSEVSVTASATAATEGPSIDGGDAGAYPKKPDISPSPQDQTGTPFRPCLKSAFRAANQATCANPFKAPSVDTTAELLRTFLWCGDIAGGAAFFTESNGYFGLSAGLRIVPDPMLINRDRNCDPDVIGFRIVAKAALDTGDFFKSAFIAVLSRQICVCPAPVHYGRRLMQSDDDEYERRDEQVQLFGDSLQTHGSDNLLNDANSNPGKRKLLMKRDERGLLESVICQRCWPARNCFMFDHCPIPDNLDEDLRQRAIALRSS